MKSKKYYVVWKGKATGVFRTWEECKKQVYGENGAQYMSFQTEELAQIAYQQGYDKHKKPKATVPIASKSTTKPIMNSIAVDAACNMSTGDMEYKGVYSATKQVLFHQQGFKDCSNNIGEFLALVHGLAYCQQQQFKDIVLYSDSQTAISWVKKKKAATKVVLTLDNQAAMELVKRAENWLKSNAYDTIIHKWQTSDWGEIPADFGRK